MAFDHPVPTAGPDPAIASTTMPAEPSLCALHVGDDPSTWRAAGFDVGEAASSDAWVQLGAVRVQLHGTGGPRGMLRWDLVAPEQSASAVRAQPAPTVGDLDGLPTAWVPRPPEADAAIHPNRVTAIDHIVVTSPDVERTVNALTAQGFRERRRRTTGRYGEPMLQVFFWVGDVILELVGPTAVPGGDLGPANFFGLALTSSDLSVTAGSLGELLGEPREAVQPGRLIATLRLDRVDGSVSTVVMSPHPGDPASA